MPPRKPMHVKYVASRGKYAVGKCGDRPFVSGLFADVKAAAEAWGLKTKRELRSTFYPPQKKRKAPKAAPAVWTRLGDCLHKVGDNKYVVKFGEQTCRLSKTFSTESKARRFASRSKGAGASAASKLVGNKLSASAANAAAPDTLQACSSRCFRRCFCWHGQCSAECRASKAEDDRQD